MTEKWVYDLSEGNATMKPILGGKGANLAEMKNVGVNVPDAFTVTTNACVATMNNDGEWPADLKGQIEDAVVRLEERTGKTLGGTENPMLLSVRSGAVVSMPGMMDTILNLGISDDNVETIGKEASNMRFAYDCYRRFIQMYGEVVEGIDADLFEDALTKMKEDKGVELDTELDADDMKELVETFKKIANDALGGEWVADPREQLMRAVDAVFRSWTNPRAEVYRKANNIPADLGTAVNVQIMVFGNRGEDCATGVCFTRNPATGAKELYGEFLTNAQGEDVVAGIRTPLQLEELEAVQPQAYKELVQTMADLELHYRDMQDLEFTIEKGELFILQTRSGKRTAAAAVKIAADMVAEDLITKEEAIERIEPAQLDHLLHPAFDTSHDEKPVGSGLAASPGAAVGSLVFCADDAAERGKAGDKVILVRYETTPDDIHGVLEAQGVLTAHGGMTSHAAVVARGFGKPCVSGVTDIKLDFENKCMTLNGKTYTEADTFSIDGTTGEVFDTALELIPPQMSDDFLALLEWSDEYRTMGVRANADGFADASKAREYGAEGIGLCRTEHMFMAPDRLPAVRKMILAADSEERAAALAEILPVQQQDFEGIFTAMKGLPVIVRLLDPPLHEFLPDFVEQSLKVQELELKGAPAAELEAESKTLEQIKGLREQNPMLGTRGCRLAMLYPEIPDMQARAIIRAALAVLEREGETVEVEIMIPLVGLQAEIKKQREVVEAAVKDELAKAGKEDMKYQIGTMIELPRAALRAKDIAEYADFFSFGTNDLTQTTLGISRDDAEAGFLGYYVDQEVMEANPFATIDTEGVGELVKVGVERGREHDADLVCGVCGEHGGDPDSIAFFQTAGISYVSCSPFRVPIARFAAAKAALANK